MKLYGLYRVVKITTHHEAGDKTFEIYLRGLDRSERITITGSSDDLSNFTYAAQFELRITPLEK